MSLKRWDLILTRVFLVVQTAQNTDPYLQEGKTNLRFLGFKILIQAQVHKPYSISNLNGDV